MVKTPTPKKKSKKDAKKTIISRSETYVICPYTDQKVWIAKATVKDLNTTKKKNGSSSIHKCGHKKRLWTISSSQIRQEHYAEVCQALSLYEQNLLPSSGGRSWEVSVKLSEPNARVLFRSWKGQMELACFPHLIDRIPTPPIWPGKRGQASDEYQAMQGEGDEGERIHSLIDREITTLSQVAWDVLRLKYDHPAPSVSLKWKAPDGKTFTSRKLAWEHAPLLSKKEVTIDRTIYGIGASGKLLKEFLPTMKTTMEVGKLRFVRDGLWVVGQELAWQADRSEELRQLEEEREARDEGKVYTTGLQLYVATNRKSYRDNENNSDNKNNNSKRFTLVQADKTLRQKWRFLSPQEQEVWNDKVQEQFEEEEHSSSTSSASLEDETNNEKDSSNISDNDDDAEEEVCHISHLQYFVQQRRQIYRFEEQMKLGEKNGRITLAQADRELRKQWREMDEKEQDDWIAKLEMEEEGKLEEKKSSMEAGTGRRSKTMSTCDDDEQGNVLEVVGQEKSDDKEDQVIDHEIKQKDTNMNTNINAVSIESSPVKSDEQNTNISEVLSASIQNEGVQSEVTRRKCPLIKHESDHFGIEFEEDKKIDDDTKPAISVNKDSTIKKCIVINSSGIDKHSVRKISSIKAFTKSTVTKQAKKRKSNQVTQKWCLQQKQIDQCSDACMEHYETVMRTVKTRDLARELADGFDVLRERGRGRFDMELPAFDTPAFDFLNNFDRTPWMPIVRAILGDDVILIHKGCFMSLPGADTQVYHQDGVHLNNQSQRPCHAINVFVPLVDLHSRNGPTEFVLGSHVLGHEGYDRDFLDTPKPTAGSPLIFDYRLGHRGLGNSSHYCRPVVYCTYARAADGKEFRDSANFSRKRYHKIGEMSGKPLSREERRNKRKRYIQPLEKNQVEIAKELSIVEAGDSEKALLSIGENGVSIDAQAKVSIDESMDPTSEAQAKDTIAVDGVSYGNGIDIHEKSCNTNPNRKLHLNKSDHENTNCVSQKNILGKYEEALNDPKDDESDDDNTMLPSTIIAPSSMPAIAGGQQQQHRLHQMIQYQQQQRQQHQQAQLQPQHQQQQEQYQHQHQQQHQNEQEQERYRELYASMSQQQQHDVDNDVDG